MTMTAVSLKGVAAKHKTAHIQAVTGPGMVIKDQIAPMAFKITDLAPDFQVVVYGSPAPKGSLEVKGYTNGKANLGSAAEGLTAWENAVRTMARLFVARTPGWECITEPVFVAISFTMPHTDASRKRGDILHEVTPDGDKLARATIDGLGIAPIRNDNALKMLAKQAQARAREQMRAEARKRAIIHDDKLVNGHLVTEKVYVGMTATALKQPGAVIQLWRKSRLT
jgi:hypothetical protein